MGVCTSRQSSIVHTTITVQPYSHDGSGQDQKSWATTLHVNKYTNQNTTEEPPHQRKPSVRTSRYSPSPAHSLKEGSTHHKASSVPKGKQLESSQESLSVSEQGPTTVPKSSDVGSTHQRSKNLRKSFIDPKNGTLQQEISVSQLPLRFLADDEKHKQGHHKKKAEEKPAKQTSRRSRKQSVLSEEFSFVSRKQSVLSEEFSFVSQSTSREYLSDEESCMIGKINVGQSMEDATEIECKNTISKIAPKEDEITFRDKVQALLSSWDESGQLAAIKLRAYTATAEDRTDIVTLARYLTKENSKLMKKLQNSPSHHVQLARAYALFTWVCINISFNVESFASKEISMPKSSIAVEAEEALLNGSTSASGYANLFAALAKAAGLDSQVINGEVFQFHITPATTDSHERAGSTNHSWNAVKVDDTWFLLDCTFGTGYLDRSKEFKRVYSRHYFATPPSKLILTHWPEKEEWQLLETPVTQEELKSIIECPAYTSGMGIEPCTWSRSIQLSGRDAAASIDLTAKHSVQITTKLTPLDNDLQISQDIVNFDNLVSIQRNADEVKIRVVLPWKGNFIFAISASQEKKQEFPTHRVCLCYRIQSPVNPVGEVGYPKVYEMAASAFGFKLACWSQAVNDYVCESYSGDLNLTFTAEKNISFSHYLISGKTRNTRPEDEGTIFRYNSIIVADSHNNSSNDTPLYMLKVVFPKDGWWTICLSGMKANPNEDVESGYTAIMSYQVYARKSKPKSTYPNIYSSQVSFCQFDPIIATSESLEVEFLADNPMNFHSFITFRHSNAEPFDCFVQVLDLENTLSSRHQYQLKAIFPKAGKWYVHVFGKEKDSTRDQPLRVLFRLLVDVENPMADAILAQVNSEFAKCVQLTVADEGYTSFCDNGLPFSIGFICDLQGIAFQHQLRLAESNSQAASEGSEAMSLIEHCSYLAYPVKMEAKAVDHVTSGEVSPANKSESSDQDVGNLAKSSHNLSQEVTPASKLPNAYRLHASFPWAGKWIVELFAKHPDEDSFILAFHVNLDIKIPSKGVCYPKIFPGFHELGFSIPEEVTTYNPLCGTSEFELPFNAPDSLQFVWSMKLNGRDSVKLRKQGFVHQFGNNRSPSHHFWLSFCKSGIWTAQLFAKPRLATIEVDNKSIKTNFLPVLEVSLRVQTINRDASFPLIYDAFTSFGLSLAKTHLPFISRVTCLRSLDPAKVVIPFFSPPDVKFWHKVDPADSSREESNLLARMVSNPDTGLHELRFKATEAGVYRISLWAQPLDSKDTEWLPVLCHTVQCTI